MSSPAAVAPRRALAGRPADTVAALVDAAVGEVAETGYDGLTIRGVARRAGVSPATAYTYFASKEHLLTEVFWRRLAALDEPRPTRRQPVADRVGDAVRDVALLVADEPELAAAITTALLAHDSDVKVVRDRIGATISARLATAIGADADPAAVQILTYTFIGALLSAGMGYATYAALPGVVADAAARMVGPRRARGATR
ncbi:MAG TPA: helix-turn-helix domain-containing protein [Mycobacteriales bacterium]|jgi:AcrR family transcriptional regulator|nr:helix-turn-helix domain-containing protein [Mycobacteriales bacterium]